MKRILHLSTGGTISSTHGREGITPTVGADSMLRLVPSVKGFCRVRSRSIMSIDSTNMQPEDWSMIARAVFESLGEFDGIVVTHGTHTMAYTASALTFMLRNLNRPVVLTGSQIPIDDGGTDAKRNLIDAFTAACEDIAGVYVVFNGTIFAGCRVSKARTKHTDAFVSVNAPPIGAVWEGRVRYFQNPAAGPPALSPLGVRSQPPGQESAKPELCPDVCPHVVLLKVYPGFNPEIFDAVIGLASRGVVIEGYGVGSIPYMKRDLLPKVGLLLDKGVHVAISTQSLFDGTDLSSYQVGRRCLEMGVIDGHDMTTEALVTKMMWALGRTSDVDEVRRIMTTNCAGEMA